MKLHPVILQLLPEDVRLHGRTRLQAQSRRAREALVLSCKASGVSLGPLGKGDCNAPLPFNGTFWSLSRKARFVATVVGPIPTTNDIEADKPPTQGPLDSSPGAAAQ